MKNIFSVPDWLHDLNGDPQNPFSFHENEALWELDTLRDSFMVQARRESFENLDYMCYDKSLPQIPDSDQFDDRFFNESVGTQQVKDAYVMSQGVSISDDQAKSNAVSKDAWIGQTSTSTNYDNSSVVSQPSEEEISERDLEGLAETPSIRTSEERTKQELAVGAGPKKEAVEKTDEESLIFLIRKVDRKTKKSKLLTKHRKRITKCEHRHLEYYAKGMCKNCYHNKGKRSKKASKCQHLDRGHYAKGLCKNCYLHFFHIKKKAKRREASCSAQSSI